MNKYIVLTVDPTNNHIDGLIDGLDEQGVEAAIKSRDLKGDEYIVIKGDIIKSQTDLGIFKGIPIKESRRIETDFEKITKNIIQENK